MAPAPDLASLIASLRAAGLRVGVDEALRLDIALAAIARTDASIDRPTLKTIVSSVIVKSTSEQQRFDELFAAWQSPPSRSGTDEEPNLSENRTVTGAASTNTSVGIAPPRPSLRVEAVPDLRSILSVSQQKPRFRRSSRSLAIASGLLGVAVIGGVGLIVIGGRGSRRAQHNPPSATLFTTDASADAGEGEDTRTSDAGDDVETDDQSGADASPANGALDARSPQGDPVSPQHVSEPNGQGPTTGTGRRELAWLGVLSLAVAAGFWGRYRRTGLPDPRPRPGRPGLAFVLPSAPVAAGGAPLRLLDRAEQEAIVWGVSRFVSDEPTNRLDVAASVAATAARAGQPVLHFQKTRHDREVWLWLDQSVGAIEAALSLSVERVAREVSRTLAAAGLRAEIAWFHGIPDRLWSEDGPFAPLEIEERGDSALIVLMTDGRVLVRALHAEDTRAQVQGNLRLFGRLPRFAVVDVGRGAHGLSTALASYGIGVIPPEAMAAFLSGSAQGEARALGAPISARELIGDARVWAAALALSPIPVDEETAFSVRERLKLKCLPWDIDILRSTGVATGGRFKFATAERARLLRWLLAISDGTPSPSTLLGASALLWREHLREEDERRARRHQAEPWHNTPAEQRLTIDRAFVDLWIDPEQALPVIYRFHGPPDRSKEDEDARAQRHPWRSLIRERMAELGPTDCEHTTRIALPWRRRDRSDVARVMLETMGFGGAHCISDRRESLRRPGRLYLAIGLAVGVALATLGTTVAVSHVRKVGLSASPQVSKDLARER